MNAGCLIQFFMSLIGASVDINSMQNEEEKHK